MERCYLLSLSSNLRTSLAPSSQCADLCCDVRFCSHSFVVARSEGGTRGGDDDAQGNPNTRTYLTSYLLTLVFSTYHMVFFPTYWPKEAVSHSWAFFVKTTHFLLAGCHANWPRPLAPGQVSVTFGTRVLFTLANATRFLWQADRQTHRGRKKGKRSFRSLIVALCQPDSSGIDQMLFLKWFADSGTWGSWFDLVDVDEMVDSHFFGSLLSSSL